MNSKQYQIFKMDCSEGRNVLNEHFRTDYKYVAGLYLYTTSDLTDCTFSARINGTEVLPSVPANLFTWNQSISRNDAIWNIEDDKIEASDKLIEVELNCSTNCVIYVCVLLKNPE